MLPLVTPVGVKPYLCVEPAVVDDVVKRVVHQPTSAPMVVRHIAVHELLCDTNLVKSERNQRCGRRRVLLRRR